MASDIDTRPGDVVKASGPLSLWKTRRTENAEVVYSGFIGYCDMFLVVECIVRGPSWSHENRYHLRALSSKGVLGYLSLDMQDCAKVFRNTQETKA